MLQTLGNEGEKRGFPEMEEVGGAQVRFQDFVESVDVTNFEIGVIHADKLPS